MNLLLRERCFDGWRSAELGKLFEMITGEEEVIAKYGDEVAKMIANYVLLCLPDLPGMVPLMEDPIEAIAYIRRNSRDRNDAYEDAWNRFGTAISALEAGFGKIFLIPKTQLVFEESDGNDASDRPDNDVRWKGPEDGPDDTSCLGGAGVPV